MLEGTTVTRRLIGFLVILALGLFVAPLAADAQRPANVPRIGMLLGNDHDAAAPTLEAFRQELHKLGYVEGQTIALEYRFAEGKVGPLPALAAELVQLPVDVIVAWGTPATQAAQRGTTTIPIVIGAALAPVLTGLVASLARPGGNITGVASSIVESGAKALEMFKEVVPRGTRVAVLWNPANSTHGLLLREVEGAAQALGVPLYPMAVSDPTEFERAFAAMVREHTGALLVIGDPTFMTRRRRIAEFAIAHGLPTMHDRREYVAVGGLMAEGQAAKEQAFGDSRLSVVHAPSTPARRRPEGAHASGGAGGPRGALQSVGGGAHGVIAERPTAAL
jgi:putative tryptophan/tyrosine transport system substrate-binding protein